MSPAAVPVIVVAGFLGSGKTTLLNYLLNVASNELGARIGVLVNDFGAINIDAMLVAGQADGAVTLTNGCMCCSVDSEGLDAALAGLLNPQAGIDAIVIEASGIADPKSLIRMVTTAADPRMRYGGLVYVIDGVGFEQLRQTHPEIGEHVAVADLVVINKTDLIDALTLSGIEAAAAELNPTGARVAVTNARVDPALLLDPVDRDEAPDDRLPRQLTLDELLAAHSDDHARSDDHAHCDGHAHDHLHDAYVSVEFVTDEAMDPRRLAEFLARPPAGCYRIKGITWFDLPGHRQCHVVHSVGGFVGVQRGTWPEGKRSTSLVAIGAGMDADEVRAVLRAAVATEASASDEHGILHITRHLPNA